jgi:hypothetical protein
VSGLTAALCLTCFRCSYFVQVDVRRAVAKKLSASPPMAELAASMRARLMNLWDEKRVRAKQSRARHWTPRVQVRGLAPPDAKTLWGSLMRWV